MTRTGKTIATPLGEHDDDTPLRLETILNAILTKYYIINPDFRIVRSNIAMDDDQSQTPSSIEGKLIREAFPLTGPDIEKTVQKVFQSGRTINIEIETHSNQSGTLMKKEPFTALDSGESTTDVVNMLVTYYPLSAVPNTVRFVLASFTDITDRKKAAIAQLVERRMLTDVVESLPNEYFMVNIEGRFHRWNRQFEKALGYTTSEISKLKLSGVIIDQRERKFWESFGQSNKQQIMPILCRMRRKDGSEIQRFIIGTVESIEDVPHMICMGVGSDSITYDKSNRIESWSGVDRMVDQLEMENVYLKEEIELEFQHSEIFGKSRGIKTVLSQVESVSTTDSSVLIVGETGTGKELIARSIHNLGKRKSRTMIKVNCAAFPPNLIEDELFGHEKGAFTGATTRRLGRFEVANGSTLFLDEIGEIPLELQAKLLRILQEGEFERIGGTQTVKVDVRIVAATNRDLQKAIKEGRFRQDLYYRLNIFPIAVPPLRERKEDVPFLVDKFVKEFADKIGKKVDLIPRETMKLLQQYNWPGNIRELRNIIERAIIVAKGPILHIGLPKEAQLEVDRPLTLDEVQKQYIESVLQKTDGKIRGKDGAAQILGMKPTTLDYRMQKLGILHYSVKTKK